MEGSAGNTARPAAIRIRKSALAAAPQPPPPPPTWPLGRGSLWAVNAPAGGARVAEAPSKGQKSGVWMGRLPEREG